MNKFVFLFFVLAFANEATLDVDLSRGMSLKQVACLRIDLFTCQLELKYFDFSILELTKWIEVISNAEQIQKDVLILKQVATLIQKARFNINQIESIAVLAQVDDSVSSLNMIKSAWAQCQVEDILNLLKEMNFSTANSQKILLADKILEKLNFMIVELTQFLQEANEYEVDPQTLQQKLEELNSKKQLCYPHGVDGAQQEQKVTQPQEVIPQQQVQEVKVDQQSIPERIIQQVRNEEQKEVEQKVVEQKTVESKSEPSQIIVQQADQQHEEQKQQESSGHTIIRSISPDEHKTIRSIEPEEVPKQIVQKEKENDLEKVQEEQQKEREVEKEKERERELEKEKERERQRKEEELEKERKQEELERKEQLEKQKEQDRQQRQREIEKELEEERQRKLLERQKQQEEELEKEREEIFKEKERLKELEKQRQKEIKEKEEDEIEKRKEAEISEIDEIDDDLKAYEEADKDNELYKVEEQEIIKTEKDPKEKDDQTKEVAKTSENDTEQDEQVTTQKITAQEEQEQDDHKNKDQIKIADDKNEVINGKNKQQELLKSQDINKQGQNNQVQPSEIQSDLKAEDKNSQSQKQDQTIENKIDEQDSKVIIKQEEKEYQEGHEEVKEEEMEETEEINDSKQQKDESEANELQSEEQGEKQTKKEVKGQPELPEQVEKEEEEVEDTQLEENKELHEEEEEDEKGEQVLEKQENDHQEKVEQQEVDKVEEEGEETIEEKTIEEKTKSTSIQEQEKQVQKEKDVDSSDQVKKKEPEKNVKEQTQEQQKANDDLEIEKVKLKEEFQKELEIEKQKIIENQRKEEFEKEQRIQKEEKEKLDKLQKEEEEIEKKKKLLEEEEQKEKEKIKEEEEKLKEKEEQLSEREKKIQQELERIEQEERKSKEHEVKEESKEKDASVVESEEIPSKTSQEDEESIKIIDLEEIDPINYKPEPKSKKSPQQEKLVVVETTTTFYESSSEGEASADFEFEDEELQDASEYGYGFWLRYMSEYPKPYTMAKNQYHFISRLTSNKQYQDFQKYGDRTLAIFLVDNIFVFATYDVEKNEKNLYENTIKVHENMEGMWYFVTFTYSSILKRSVGYIARYGRKGIIKSVNIKTTHVPPFYLFLVIGGKHMHYPGFNGQFANIFYDVDAPAFIDSERKLHDVIKNIANPPQALLNQIDQDVVTDVRHFNGNEENQQVAEAAETQMIIEQYSVAIWFRWVDDLDVSNPNAFQVFNLRSNNERKSAKGQLGDRNLECHFVFGGTQDPQILLNTYTIFGKGGAGVPYVSKRVESPNLIWTYVYMGYSHDRARVYGAVIQPGFANEVLFRKIQHKLSTKLLFTVGHDSQYASFNGKIAYCTFYVGPKSYQEGLVFKNTFGFGTGAEQLFQLQKPILITDEEEGEPNKIRGSYAELDHVFDTVLIHHDQKQKINGQSEYAFGLWTRWLRSSPKFLIQRAALHQIVRIGTEPHDLESVEGDEEQLLRKIKRGGEKKVQTIRDNTLTVFAGLGFYQFSTYTVKPKLQGGITKEINYNDRFEGFWNYIYLGYKRGQAKGYIQFGGEGDVEECQMDVSHYFLKEYLELSISKEQIQQNILFLSLIRTLPLFNGYLTRISLKIGPGAFIPDKNLLKQVVSGTLPDAANLKPVKRKTLSLITSPVEIQEGEEEDIEVNEDAEDAKQDSKSDEPKKEEIYEFNFIDSPFFQGAAQYSISGWVKWSGMQKTGNTHAVALFAQKDLEEVSGHFGEQTLNILRGDENFRFITYSCSNEQCKQDLRNDQSYLEYWDQWTFLYFGYQQSKVFGYLKFTFSEQKFFIQDIYHFYMSRASVQIGRSRHDYRPWHGQMKTWVINFGEGSYREGQFDIDENTKVHFGFVSGSDHIKLQQAGQEVHHDEQILECSANDERTVIPLHVEFKQGDNLHLQGVSEYGYGYWSRFVYLGEKGLLYNKPAWLGMSRLTTNKEYKDFDQPGDRTLAVQLGKGFYHFSTYNMQPLQPNVNANLKYPPEMEGEWVYIYFSYKQFSSQQGRAVAFMTMGEIMSGIQMQVLHQPLRDYMQITIGHTGKYYQNFNGKITKIRFNLGPGAFIDKKATITDKIKQKDPQPEPYITVPKRISVLKGKHDIQGDKLPFENPVKFDNFHNVREYSVQMWFRWFRQETKQQQVLFRLTTSDTLSDFQKPGDRALMMTHLTGNSGTSFSTYTAIEQDQFKSPLSFTCSINQALLEVWTFAYMGYQRGRIAYFMKADNFVCKGLEKGLHVTPKTFWLYLSQDSILDRFNGRLAMVEAAFSDGAFKDDNFEQLMSTGEHIFKAPPKFTWEERKDEVIELAQEGEEASTIQVFEDGDKFPIESVSEYAFGFWTRFTSAIPERLLVKPAKMQIARFTTNRETPQNNRPLQLGDLALAACLSFQNYVFSTYDLQNANIEGTLSYNDELEGTWRYIYMAYSRNQQQVVAHIFKETVETKVFRPILHQPLSDFASLRVGKEADYLPSFQGIITEMIVLFGEGAFMEHSEQIKKFIEMTNGLSVDLTEDQKKQRENEELMGEPVKMHNGKELSGTTWLGASEYSICGWFKVLHFTEKMQDKKTDEVQPPPPDDEQKEDGNDQEEQQPEAYNDCEIIFRVTNNDKAYQGDKTVQGDRTLYSEMCGGSLLRLSTYTLLGLRDFNEARHFEGKFELSAFARTWVYIYMGYSAKIQEVHLAIHYSTIDLTKVFQKVQHFIPNYIGIFLGKDSFKPKFSGQLQKWTASYGTGAFTAVTRRGFQDLLLNYNAVTLDKSFQWSIQEEDKIKSTSGGEQEFHEEADGVLEYAVGMWTRWLTEFPEKLMDRQKQHIIYRFTTTREYADQTEAGNRVLVAFAGIGHFAFSTYDLAKNDPAIISKVPYDSKIQKLKNFIKDTLEGQWNYIYQGYSIKENICVAMVLFRDEKKVERTTIQAKHMLMSGYAKFVYAKKEFGYLPFHGYIYDPRVYLGSGSFVENGQKLVDMFITQHKVPPLSPSAAADFTWPIDQVDATTGIEKFPLSFEFHDKEDVQEYSYGLWIQPAMLSPDQQQNTKEYMVIRLTTNSKEVQSDDQLAGDRTLLTLFQSEQLVFSTYTLKDPKYESLRKNMATEKYQWIFLYFGYSPIEKKAYAYSIFPSREQGEMFHEVRHIIPKDFFLYLIKDQIYPKFYGKMSGVKVYFGIGAYTTKPKELIDKWPYDPNKLEMVESAQIVRLGMNSAQIIKKNKRSSQVYENEDQAQNQVSKIK